MLLGEEISYLLIRGYLVANLWYCNVTLTGNVIILKNPWVLNWSASEGQFGSFGYLVDICWLTSLKWGYFKILVTFLPFDGDIRELKRQENFQPPFWLYNSPGCMLLALWSFYFSSDIKGQQCDSLLLLYENNLYYY